MEFTDEDIANIKKAKDQGDNIWTNDLLADLKQRIKAFCRERQNQQCCYCKRPMNGEFKMVIDIEHILPKSKYKYYMFKLPNLAVSCKRCNMPNKGESVSFFTGEKEDEETHFINTNYKFIHPNLEDYFAHIDYNVTIANNEKMIKYAIKNDSPKGKFTYDFFRLIELEIDSFSTAQGVYVVDLDRNNIDDDNAKKIEDILK